ncbi:hypothetical protein [Candidatus Amarolinea dominans]|jgi:hypothetical protein|uniref:hypothetical protein n=1 Tax=Candidatus Amarolinea dominans TaxID=3140696 RepID=UPI001D26F45D|nr:hypothetical protein [Anaerolineae bacterium]MBK7200254.1 hypothetical protein [Anaerolineae bacterium]
MLTQNVLQEVITLPEASVLAAGMGHGLDRSNLLRYARTGRLVARKSGGTWLTTRAALEVLIVELAGETRGRPRAQSAAWAEVTMTPELEDILARIDRLRAELAQQVRSPINDQRQRRELIVEAIYHTNHLEGNQLSLPEVRAVVEAFWVETNGHGGISQDEQSPRRRRSS